MSCTNCSQSGSSISFDMQCFFNSGCPGCADNDCGNNIQNARCVIYTGPNLPCSGIETNDSVELALQKIDEQICSILGDYSTYQFHCLEEFFGDEITTEADFVDAISDYVCTLRADFETFTEVTFVNYQTTVNNRFVAIEQPGITCGSAGVISTDSLIDVLEKYCEKFEDIDEALSIEDVDWNQCLTVVNNPTTIEEAFSLVIDQICQVKTLATESELPTINNTGSCIGGTASDSIPTTISLLRTRVCQTPTFDKDDLTWSCLTPPSFANDQDITSALQEIIDLIVSLRIAIPTFDSGDFQVTQTNGSNACDGVTVALQTSLDTDRFVAATALDGSPDTLIEKLDAGTGISITNNADTTLIIANTAPDVPVVLTQGSGITITGTYPNFTISAAAGTDTNFAKDDLTFTGNRLHNMTGFTCTLTAGTLFMDVARFETDLGGTVTSSNNTTLGGDGNVFKVSGNTQINAITTTGWQAGSQVVLEFTGTPTVKHNTAGGAGTAPFFLAGSVDFVAGVGDSLSLYYNGTHWHEQSRKIAATVTALLFRNGLTESPAGIVELGGTLLHDTTISTTASHTLTVAGVANTPNISFEVSEGATHLHKTATGIPANGSYTVFASNQHTISAAPTFTGTFFYGGGSFLERLDINANSTQNGTALVAGAAATLQLTSSSSSTYTVNQAGIRTLCALNTQVNLPSASGGVTTTVNHTSSIQIWPLQQSTGATNTVILTNYYGLLINDILDDSSFLGVTVNKWALYQEGSGDNNYFAGNVGIGNTAPTQRLQITDGRFGMDKGADIAAANDLTLGNDGNFFIITGGTQINAITVTNWQAGSGITLMFTGTPTIKHNTAGGAGTAPMKLLNGVDFTISKNPTLVKFAYDGTNWQEVSRSANAV